MVLLWQARHPLVSYMFTAFAIAPQLGDVRRDPPRLIARQQLGVDSH